MIRRHLHVKHVILTNKPRYYAYCGYMYNFGIFFVMGFCFIIKAIILIRSYYFGLRSSITDKESTSALEEIHSSNKK